MELEIIAFIASALSVSGCLPQIIKIMRTQNTQALSYSKYYMAAIGGALWVSYGLMAPLYSIVFWNTISTIMAVTVIILKFRNEQSQCFQPILTASTHIKNTPIYTTSTAVATTIYQSVGRFI
jgi:MtN3 and saliva related transmembrane protein